MISELGTLWKRYWLDLCLENASYEQAEVKRCSNVPTDETNDGSTYTLTDVPAVAPTDELEGVPTGGPNDTPLQNKRSQDDDDDDDTRNDVAALKHENKRLKKEIEFLKANYVRKYIYVAAFPHPWRHGLLLWDVRYQCELRPASEIVRFDSGRIVPHDNLWLRSELEVQWAMRVQNVDRIVVSDYRSVRTKKERANRVRSRCSAIAVVMLAAETIERERIWMKTRWRFRLKDQ